VFVAGLSLGSLLSVHLAVEVKDLAGLVLISPAFWVRDWRLQLVPLLHHLVPMWPKNLEVEGSDLSDPEARNRYWCYDVHPTAALNQLRIMQRLTRHELASVRVPTLVVYSTRDRDVGGFSGQRTYASLGAGGKHAMVLQDSGHCLVVDGGREAVFERVYSWMQVHSRTLAGPAEETNPPSEGE
jgi:esterase/lipase